MIQLWEDGIKATHRLVFPWISSTAFDFGMSPEHVAIWFGIPVLVPGITLVLIPWDHATLRRTGVATARPRH